MNALLDVRAVPKVERLATKPRAATVTSNQASYAYGAEQYRVLSHMVQQLGKVGRKVIAISSPVSGDGKTTTSVNLARTLSQSSGADVLLVDADLRRGTLSEQLGFGKSVGGGLSGAISNPGFRLDMVTRTRPGLAFSVLPAGTYPAMPYEALLSSRMGEVVAEARRLYDTVVLDTPPVVPVADLRAISQWVDGVILVVNAHVTPRGLLDEALSALDGEKVIGIVYNGDDMPLSRRYRSYYSYGESTPAPALWPFLPGASSPR